MVNSLPAFSEEAASLHASLEIHSSHLGGGKSLFPPIKLTLPCERPCPTNIVHTDNLPCISLGTEGKWIKICVTERLVEPIYYANCPTLLHMYVLYACLSHCCTKDNALGRLNKADLNTGNHKETSK